MAFSLHKERNKTVFTDHAKAHPLLEEAEFCSFHLEILQMQLVVSSSADSFSKYRRAGKDFTLWSSSLHLGKEMHQQ